MTQSDPPTPAAAAPIVTIDGPSGSGKGTVSRAVARHVGWHLLDSGALYRLVALASAAWRATSSGARPAVAPASATRR